MTDYNARAEAWKRYDGDRIIDDRTGEEVYHDDWGYADTARQAFIAGVEWQASRPFTEEDVDRVAVAIAKAANADYWTDEIAEWEARDKWEQEIYEGEYPGMAYEDREWFREQARAALGAVAARHTNPKTGGEEK